MDMGMLHPFAGADEKGDRILDAHESPNGDTKGAWTAFRGFPVPFGARPTDAPSGSFASRVAINPTHAVRSGPLTPRRPPMSRRKKDPLRPLTDDEHQALTQA